MRHIPALGNHLFPEIAVGDHATGVTPRINDHQRTDFVSCHFNRGLLNGNLRGNGFWCCADYILYFCTEQELLSGCPAGVCLAGLFVSLVKQVDKK